MASKSAYGASAREIGELFADYIDGGADRPALVLGTKAVGSAARNAVEKSLEAFGYAPPACTFAVTGELDPQAVYLLVEGIDPLFVIAADNAAAATLARAYRCDYAPDTPIRVGGRSGIAFADLAKLMETPQSKQAAWSLLKTLRK